MDESWQSTDPRIDKLAVAGGHVRTAMQLIALDAEPLSTQVIVMSADAVIQAVARHRGVELPHADDLVVKHEHLREWFAAKHRAANYAKHADWDPEEVYAGPHFDGLRRLNDVHTMMNVVGLETLTGRSVGLFKQFTFAVGLLYPQFLRWNVAAESSPEMARMVENRPDVDRPTYLRLLRHVLRQERLLPYP